MEHVVGLADPMPELESTLDSLQAFYRGINSRRRREVRRQWDSLNYKCSLFSEVKEDGPLKSKCQQGLCIIGTRCGLKTSCQPSKKNDSCMLSREGNLECRCKRISRKFAQARGVRKACCA